MNNMSKMSVDTLLCLQSLDLGVLLMSNGKANIAIVVIGIK
jgi:hypothetical protein